MTGSASRPGPGEACAATAVAVGAEGHLVHARALAGAGISPPRHDRIRAAVLSSGEPWPPAGVSIMLAPAGFSWDSRTGAQDLAAAIAALAVAGAIPAGAGEGWVFVAGLGPDGALRPVPGVVPALAGAVRAGCGQAVVAAANAAEAAAVPGVRVLAFERLAGVARWLRGEIPPPHCPPAPPPAVTEPPGELAALGVAPAIRLAAEAAAAGGHHLCLAGPAAARIPALAAATAGLLPPLTPAESLETSAAHSAAGLLGPHQPMITAPPLRAPHHTTPCAGLAGGGTRPAGPGEIALAHHGVLFLGQAPRFPRAALAAVRHALDTGEVTVARGGVVTRFPARFLLASELPPCPCGPGPGCGCTPAAARRYRARLTSTLGAHLAIWAWAPATTAPVPATVADSTADLASVARVAGARKRARDRLAGTPWLVNAAVPPARIARYCPLPPAARAPARRAVDSGQISSRAAAQVTALAWTLADLAGAGRPGLQEWEQALALHMGAAP